MLIHSFFLDRDNHIYNARIVKKELGATLGFLILSLSLSAISC